MEEYITYTFIPVGWLFDAYFCCGNHSESDEFLKFEDDFDNFLIDNDITIQSLDAYDDYIKNVTLCGPESSIAKFNDVYKPYINEDTLVEGKLDNFIKKAEIDIDYAKQNREMKKLDKELKMQDRNKSDLLKIEKDFNDGKMDANEFARETDRIKNRTGNLVKDLGYEVKQAAHDADKFAATKIHKAKENNPYTVNKVKDVSNKAINKIDKGADALLKTDAEGHTKIQNFNGFVNGLKGTFKLGGGDLSLGSTKPKKKIGSTTISDLEKENPDYDFSELRDMIKDGRLKG